MGTKCTASCQCFLVATSLLLFVILFAACAADHSQGSDSPALDMVKVPTMTIQAVVLEAALDPDYRDTGTVKIESIGAVENPDNRQLSGIQQGAEVQAVFIYSTRPAILTMIKRSPENSTELFVSGHHNDPELDEHGYLSFEEQSSNLATPYEIVLPGLTPGSRFTAVASYESPGHIIIGDYKLVP